MYIYFCFIVYWLHIKLLWTCIHLLLSMIKEWMHANNVLIYKKKSNYNTSLRICSLSKPLINGHYMFMYMLMHFVWFLSHWQQNCSFFFRYFFVSHCIIDYLTNYKIYGSNFLLSVVLLVILKLKWLSQIVSILRSTSKTFKPSNSEYIK